MNTIEIILNVLLVLLAIAMIAFILLQRGAGAQAGSGFGAGASGTVFGARGAATFLTRTTAILATVFFVLSLTLGVITARTHRPSATSDLGVMSQLSSDSTAAESAWSAGTSEVPVIQSEAPAAASTSEVPQIELVPAEQPPVEGGAAVQPENGAIDTSADTAEVEAVDEEKSSTPERG